MKILYVLLAILGVWLIYWNITDFMVTGLDQGIWDWSIIKNGLNSIIVGVILILIFIHKGIRVLI